MKINFTIFLFFIFILLSCNKKQEKNNEIIKIQTDTQEVNLNIDTNQTTNSDTQIVQITEAVIEESNRCDILEKYNIPQSDEILIEDSTLIPDFNLLYKVDLVKLNTVYSQSVIFGIFSADLIYSTLFKNKNYIIEYYTLSGKLADKLGFGRILNKKDVTNIENQSDLDTIKSVVFEKTRKVCIELSKQNSYVELSYILYGAMIEDNFLIVNTLIQNPSASDSLYKKLYEQVEVIDNVVNYYNFVLSVIDNYDISLDLNAMINDLTEIKKVYDKIYNRESFLVNSEELKELNRVLRKYRSNLLIGSDKKIEMQVKKNKIPLKNK